MTDYVDTENSLTQDFILNNAIFNFNISIQLSILTTLNWKKEWKERKKTIFAIVTFENKSMQLLVYLGQC